MPGEESKSKPRPIFPPFQGPNYTIVPDEVFDVLLSVLSGSELKVLLYIIRRTFGFKRDADNISLNQMLHGITTRDGKVLDRGVGLSKPSLLLVLRSLQEMNLILTERRRSAERGNEPTSYRLNVATPLGQEMRPPLVKKFDQGVGQEISPSPRSKNLTTQETERQEIEQQHVVAELTERGVTTTVAQELARTHSQAEVQLQVAVFDWLKESHPKRLGKNAPGYLRKAIEQVYQPPEDYKSPEQRRAEEERRAEELAALEQRLQAEKAELDQAREAARQLLEKQHQPQQIEGTGLTTETAWQMALERLKSTMSAANYGTWLSDTVLISCDRSKALLVAPSRFVAGHLEQRFTALIKKELETVVGFRPQQIDYLALTELDANSAENGQTTASLP